LTSAKEKFALGGDLIEKGKLKEGLKQIFHLAEEGNRFLATTVPWQKIKSQKEQTQKDLWTAAATIHGLGILIEPFLPKTSERILKLLNLNSGKIDWEFTPNIKYSIAKPVPLFVKIEDKQIEAEKQRLKAEAKNGKK